MIRKLPKEVVDRIAAGEVIERPSSVVKELVENALDAGATRVEVALEKGGSQLIRISDDGSGITLPDLGLAFVPHATSKLTEVDDLLAIASYGFRGEALSSIGAVSRARIKSRAEDAEGFEVTCEGGIISEIKPCGTPKGTVIEVRNLFFNIPARARFLKGDSAEASRCLDQVLRFALLDEGVGFRMSHNDKIVFEVAANATRAERFARAYGDELAVGLIEFSHQHDAIYVEGLLAPPEIARATARHQLLFMNGRIVNDGALKAAVKQAYREFLAPTLHPVYAIFLTIDPAEVDVNVHPAKSEVRFRNASEVFRAVYHGVLDALRGADLTPRPGGIPPRQETSTAPPTSNPSPSSKPERAASDRDPTRPAKQTRSLFGDGTRLSPLPPDDLGVHVTANADAKPDEPVARYSDSTSSPLPIALPEEVREVEGHPSLPPRTGRGWLRLFSTYILYESSGELCIVDQHALHERVMYEQLRRQLTLGKIPSQRLLVPAVVEVGRSRVMAAEELGDSFAAVGLEISAISETAVAVHAIPTLLKRGAPDDLVEAVLDAWSDGDRGAHARLEEPLHTMACRAAVKAGDHLEDAEVQALLDQASKIPEAKACPHGRPTSIRMSKGDLERWFKRSGF